MKILSLFGVRATFRWLAALSLALLASPQPVYAWIATAEAGVETSALAPDASGSVAVAGTRRDASGGSALYAASYLPDGSRAWSALLPGGTWNTPAGASAVAVDAAGDVYVTGAASLRGGAPGFVVAKAARATGKWLWVSAVKPQVSGQPAVGGSGLSLSLDARGHVVAGGYVQAGDQPWALVTALDASTGVLTWDWTQPGGQVRALAVDGQGDVAATGPALGIKLSGEDGHELWRVARSETRIGAAGYPMTRTLVIDRSGDVLIGGSLRNTQEDSRVAYLARLDGASGQVKWEFAGAPGAAFESLARVTVTGSGGILAAGRVGAVPAALGLDEGQGRLRWLQRPWLPDGRVEASPVVTGLVADSRLAYVCGAEGANRFLAAAITLAGRPKWRRDLGVGQATAEALGPGGRLYLVGHLQRDPRRPAEAVIVGLQASTGADLRARR